MTKRVALVTGSNKGIGEAIVKGLIRSFDGDVFVLSRKPSDGQEAIERIKAEVNDKSLTDKLQYHQLDVTDKNSWYFCFINLYLSVIQLQHSINNLHLVSCISALAEAIQQRYGGLNLLVNNAGVMFMNASPVPMAERTPITLNTNYFGVRWVSDALWPLLRENARVVNVASRAGLVVNNSLLSKPYAPEHVRLLLDPSVTIEQLDQLADNFIRYAQEGTLVEHGLPESPYCFSKAVCVALTVAQARENGVQGVLINCCCPGSVNTSMMQGKGKKTVEDGADTPLYLATLPVGATGPNGKFYAEREEIVQSI